MQEEQINDLLQRERDVRTNVQTNGGADAVIIRMLQDIRREKEEMMKRVKERMQK